MSRDLRCLLERSDGARQAATKAKAEENFSHAQGKSKGQIVADAVQKGGGSRWGRTGNGSAFVHTALVPVALVDDFRLGRELGSSM